MFLLPKDHWTLKTGYFEDPTPAIQVQTLPLEGPMILGASEKKTTKKRNGSLSLSIVTVGFWAHFSGQTPQKVAKERKSPYFSGKSRLVKYYNLARFLVPSTSEIWRNQNIIPLRVRSSLCGKVCVCFHP